jgi:hypothetical protein
MTFNPKGLFSVKSAYALGIRIRDHENGTVLGNSGKPVTLETLGLTKFLRHVFQRQGTHDFRRFGTCEASDSRMYEVRGS